MEKNKPSATILARSLTLLCCVAAILFANTATRAQNADIDILRDIYVGRPAGLKTPASVISASAYPLSLAVPVGIYIYGLAAHSPKDNVRALQMATGLAVAVGGSYVLKYIVQRDRPSATYPDIVQEERGSAYSFPSGHTSAAFATATSLSLQYRKWYIVVPAYAWAGAVGYSRMYQGMHYPSDVLAGAIIGAGSAYISYRVQRWAERKWLSKYVNPPSLERP